MVRGVILDRTVIAEIKRRRGWGLTMREISNDLKLGLGTVKKYVDFELRCLKCGSAGHFNNECEGEEFQLNIKSKIYQDGKKHVELYQNGSKLE